MLHQPRRHWPWIRIAVCIQLRQRLRRLFVEVIVVELDIRSGLWFRRQLLFELLVDLLRLPRRQLFLDLVLGRLRLRLRRLSLPAACPAVGVEQRQRSSTKYFGTTDNLT